MKSRDDLISVLTLGWETARRAWRLLSPDSEFTVDAVGTSGRDMDQVAYDLRRLGYGKPARLAFSVAFILNGLAGRTIEYDRDLAEKASQIVSILAEMLLELEATSQVTAQEPAEIVELLQSRWGLVLWTEDHAATQLPRPHFRVEGPLKHAADEVLASVAEISESLILASESLLQRAERDSEFPYLPSLSRIHHLGILIRERVAAHLPANSEATSLLAERLVAKTLIPPESQMIEIPTENEAVEAPAELIDNAMHELVMPSSTGVHHLSDRTQKVLIVDESPFFRMLLTSAMESAGYETHVVSSLREAHPFDVENWSLMICGADQLADAANLAWLDGCGVCAVLLESTAMNNAATHGPGHVHSVRRTDIAGLMSLVKSILGPNAGAVRLSA